MKRCAGRTNRIPVVAKMLLAGKRLYLSGRMERDDDKGREREQESAREENESHLSRRAHDFRFTDDGDRNLGASRALRNVRLGGGQKLTNDRTRSCGRF